MNRNLVGVVFVAVAVLAAACSAGPSVAPPGDMTRPPVETPNVVPPEPMPPEIPRVPEVGQAPPLLPPPPLSVPPALGSGYPTPTPVPVADIEVRRSGETCTLNGSSATVSFQVPDNMWAVECVAIEYADPFQPGCCGLPLSVRISPRSMWQVLQDVESAEDANIRAAEWIRVGDQSGWLLDVSVSVHDRPTPYNERWLVMDLALETLIVAASDLPTTVESGQLEPLHQELLDTLVVTRTGVAAAGTWNAPPDRWCSGDSWAIEIPEMWFATNSCDGTPGRVWLSTSPVQMQCDCPGPLWVERDWGGVDWDITTVRSDTEAVRADGTPVRVLEVKIEGGAADPVDARVVIVPVGESDVAVIANRIPTHSGPALTFEETLAAQQKIVDSLRSWGGEGCGSGELVRAVHGAPLLASVDTGELVEAVPSGTALQATGCVQERDGQEWREVQTLPVTNSAGPTDQRSSRGQNLVGWIDASAVTTISSAQCPEITEVTDDDFEWTDVVGDFDGDGSEDLARLRDRDNATVEVAFFFADGSATAGPVELEHAGRLMAVGDVLGVMRLVGMDRDVFVVNDPNLGGAYTSLSMIVGVVGCVPTAFGAVTAGSSVAYHLGYCLAPTPFGLVLRSFSARSDLYKVFGAYQDDHLVWAGTELEPLSEYGLGTKPMCGPQLVPDRTPQAWSGPAGPLEGVHGLSLQWLGVDSSEWGEIAFRTVGTDQYQVTGRQGAAEGVPGDFLDIRGIVEQGPDGNLHFEGNITTQIAFLNNGQQCSRGGGQDFSITPGRSYWRMQDQINCDRETTDYIDIYFG